MHVVELVRYFKSQELKPDHQDASLAAEPSRGVDQKHKLLVYQVRFLINFIFHCKSLRRHVLTALIPQDFAAQVG
jgi:hypothetical protein